MGAEERTKLGDDDRQSRAFIFFEWKSGRMMVMMVVGMEGVRENGEGAEVGEEVAERNAGGGNASEKLLWKIVGFWNIFKLYQLQLNRMRSHIVVSMVHTLF